MHYEKSDILKVSLRPELYERLANVSFIMGKPKATIIRMALVKYLDELNIQSNGQNDENQMCIDDYL